MNGVPPVPPPIACDSVPTPIARPQSALNPGPGVSPHDPIAIKRSLTDPSAFADHAVALRGQYRQYVDAGLIAAPASIRADAAMLVVVCMPLTLLRAGATHLGACLHDRPREVRLELGLPAEDPGPWRCTRSAQSRQRRIQRIIMPTSSSARSASTSAVQLCAQSKHASMHSSSAPDSIAAPRGCVSSIC